MARRPRRRPMRDIIGRAAKSTAKQVLREVSNEASQERTIVAALILQGLVVGAEYRAPEELLGLVDDSVFLSDSLLQTLEEEERDDDPTLFGDDDAE